MKTCSIIIPTRDRPQNLLRAVRSALAAMPQDGEIIVVDDASKVPASEVIQQLGDPRITVLRNDSPLAGGGSPSRNKGAAAAIGQTLFFLDDDDELIETYCQDVLDHAQHAQFGFSARKFCATSDTGNPTWTTENRKLPAGVISPTSAFKSRTFPFSAGFWITQDAYAKAGPFAENLSTNSDTEYCLRMYDTGLTGTYSDTPGVIIHEHQSTQTGELANVTSRSKSSDRADAFKTMAQTHARYLAAHPDAADFIYRRWVKHALRANDTSRLAEAASTAPSLLLRLKLRVLIAASRLLRKSIPS